MNEPIYRKEDMTMEKRKHLEETIISVLRTLSDVEDITLDNKIDDLGLDSIRWIQFFTHLEENGIYVEDFTTIYIESLNIETLSELSELIAKYQTDAPVG